MTYNANLITTQHLCIVHVLVWHKILIFNHIYSPKNNFTFINYHSWCFKNCTEKQIHAHPSSEKTIAMEQIFRKNIYILSIDLKPQYPIMHHTQVELNLNSIQISLTQHNYQNASYTCWTCFEFRFFHIRVGFYQMSLTYKWTICFFLHSVLDSIERKTKMNQCLYTCTKMYLDVIQFYRFCLLDFVSVYNNKSCCFLILILNFFFT